MSGFINRPYSAMSAAFRDINVFELVTLDRFNQVQHNWYEGGAWSHSYTSGGLTDGPTYPPAVTSLAIDKVEVFVRGLNGKLWWQTWGAH